jgi:hypothetical protein
VKVYSFEQGRGVASEIGNRYASSRYGRRYVATHQTPGTGVTGQTSFVATTPTLSFTRAAASTRIILSGMTFSQIGTVAGGVIALAVLVDTTDRYASGGTELTPQGMSLEQDRAADTTVYFNPTAAAASANVRVLFQTRILKEVGRIISINFGDSIHVGATGSILVYTWAATTGPTWLFDVEFIEEDL